MGKERSLGKMLLWINVQGNRLGLQGKEKGRVFQVNLNICAVCLKGNFKNSWPPQSDFLESAQRAKTYPSFPHLESSAHQRPHSFLSSGFRNKDFPNLPRVLALPHPADPQRVCVCSTLRQLHSSCGAVRKHLGILHPPAGKVNVKRVLRYLKAGDTLQTPKEQILAFGFRLQFYCAKRQLSVKQEKHLVVLPLKVLTSLATPYCEMQETKLKHLCEASKIIGSLTRAHLFN